MASRRRRKSSSCHAGQREAALRYLDRLAEQGTAAETSSAVAEVLTEVAAIHGLLPPVREAVVRAWTTSSDLQGAALGEESEPIARLGDTTRSMSEAARVILHARDHAAHPAQRSATAPPPGRVHPPVSRHR
ncbi:hypothetical protein [Streptomyces paludis]|uniref:hypothetical protein n=1 Tax=Streptomyces paludis TaxID=2282738 RepID=UPI001E34F26A|nr:hypothetical protein [Streptomyces paludis]